MSKQHSVLSPLPRQQDTQPDTCNETAPANKKKQDVTPSNTGMPALEPTEHKPCRAETQGRDDGTQRASGPLRDTVEDESIMLDEGRSEWMPGAIAWSDWAEEQARVNEMYGGVVEMAGD